MIRLLRIFGMLMIVAGALVLASYLIKPLRQIWPALRQLPLPIQIGLGIAAAGLLLLFATLLWERFEEREADRELLDDDEAPPESTELRE